MNEGDHIPKTLRFLKTLSEWYQQLADSTPETFPTLAQAIESAGDSGYHKGTIKKVYDELWIQNRRLMHIIGHPGYTPKASEFLEQYLKFSGGALAALWCSKYVLENLLK